MSSGARHGIGVVVGLVVTAAVAGCLSYGINRTAIIFQSFLISGHWSDRLIAAGVLLVAAVLLGLAMGSRLSPVASLIPGVVFTVIGLMWVLAPRFAAEHTMDVLPRRLDRGYSIIGPYGILLVLGVALLVASLSPSRWRVAGASPARSRYGSQPGPMGPGGAVPPPYGASAPPVPQYQPAPSPYAPGPAGPPPYAAPAPPAAPGGAQHQPEPSEPPRQGGGQQRQQAGEWTQMYGGDDLRGGRSDSSGS